MHYIIVDARSDSRRDGFRVFETREAAERELAAAHRTLPSHEELDQCAVREARLEDYSPGFRVVVTEEPSAETVEKTHALIGFAALTAAGHAAIARGGYDPGAVGAEAGAMTARLVDGLARSIPVDESEARMIATAVRLAGGQCEVVHYTGRSVRRAATVPR